jgi:hypothetical protein
VKASGATLEGPMDSARASLLAAALDEFEAGIACDQSEAIGDGAR